MVAQVCFQQEGAALPSKALAHHFSSAAQIQKDRPSF
jgi:hypothetical protein